MEAKMITAGARDKFRKLLTPSVYAALINGVPVVTIGLIDDNTAAGAIAGMVEEGNIFSVMSLYVAPDHRRRGGGRLLIESLCRILEEEDYPPAVLTFVEGDGESDMIAPFMEALGIGEDTGSEKLYHGTVRDFADYGFGSGEDTDPFIRPVTELGRYELAAFKDFVRHTPTDYKGGGMASFKADRAGSYAVVTGDGEMIDFFIAGHTRNHPDDITVRVSGLSDQAMLRSLIDVFIREIISIGGADKEVFMPVPDDRYEDIFDAVEGVRNIQHSYIL